MERLQCPPHHWQLSVVRIDGVPYDHHRCARCGAEKDTPLTAPASMYPERTQRGSPPWGARAPAKG